jgi:hypothetical protein
MATRLGTKGGDPASLEEDPAQVYPTGGVGVYNRLSEPDADANGGAE